MMRSISYILGGKPSNMPDCLDYGTKHKLQRIILTLLVPEEITDEYSVRWLKGSFIWFFDNQTISYEITFGGCFLHESDDRRLLSIDNANERLKHELETIRSRIPNIPVENEQQRFDYSVTERNQT